MSTTYNIIIEGSTIDHGSCVVNNQSTEDYAIPPISDAVLQQLQELQKSIEQTEPIISGALAELQDAIRKQDEHKILKMIKQLSSGFAASVLANVASPFVLSFLGIGT